MGHYFLDSSALIKRYITETGTQWVCSLCISEPENAIHISRITVVEVIAAIFKRLRQGDLSSDDAQVVAQQFKEDFKISSLEILD